MRINQFVARATGLSRRKADDSIRDRRVTVNGESAKIGQLIKAGDEVKLDSEPININHQRTLLVLDKPVDYVCSRNRQGNKTIYDLIPKKYHYLKPIGRLDKDTTGILLLTDDGQLSQELSHPKYNKEKIYTATLDKSLDKIDKLKLENGSVKLDNKPSLLKISKIGINKYSIEIHEGRNRQIRRTFNNLNYQILNLKRIQFGPYNIDQLEGRPFTIINLNDS
ncbi:MAG TPA: pseudouridine synthase [Candidatus Saccharimonadia bacterium]|nr:pseudouridine synthase [Candidatus Saccharimonadia bacterium]